jgi:hypothetical protein
MSGIAGKADTERIVHHELGRHQLQWVGWS